MDAEGTSKLPPEVQQQQQQQREEQERGEQEQGGGKEEMHECDVKQPPEVQEQQQQQQQEEQERGEQEQGGGKEETHECDVKQPPEVQEQQQQPQQEERGEQERDGGKEEPHECDVKQPPEVQEQQQQQQEEQERDGGKEETRGCEVQALLERQESGQDQVRHDDLRGCEQRAQAEQERKQEPCQGPSPIGLHPPQQEAFQEGEKNRKEVTDQLGPCGGAGEDPPATEPRRESVAEAVRRRRQEAPAVHAVDHTLQAGRPVLPRVATAHERVDAWLPHNGDGDSDGDGGVGGGGWVVTVPATRLSGSWGTARQQRPFKRPLDHSLFHPLPVDASPESRRRRAQLFEAMDLSGTGRLSLAEITRGARELLVLDDRIVGSSYVMMAAFKAGAAGAPDGLVGKQSLLPVLKVLKWYSDLADLYRDMEEHEDEEVGIRAFIDASHRMETFGLPVRHAEADFLDISQGRDRISFQEFLDWAGTARGPTRLPSPPQRVRRGQRRTASVASGVNKGCGGGDWYVRFYRCEDELAGHGGLQSLHALLDMEAAHGAVDSGFTVLTSREVGEALFPVEGSPGLGRSGHVGRVVARKYADTLRGDPSVRSRFAASYRKTLSCILGADAPPYPRLHAIASRRPSALRRLVTRILHSLHTFGGGMQHHAADLIDLLIGEMSISKALHALKDACRSQWIPVLEEERDKVDLFSKVNCLVGEEEVGGRRRRRRKAPVPPSAPVVPVAAVGAWGSSRRHVPIRLEEGPDTYRLLVLGTPDQVRITVHCLSLHIRVMPASPAASTGLSGAVLIDDLADSCEMSTRVVVLSHPIFPDAAVKERWGSRHTSVTFRKIPDDAVEL